MRSLLYAALIGAALATLPAAAQEPVDRAMLARIKEEGLQRSRAQGLYFALTDGIGARLTGSPSHVQAARWTLQCAAGAVRISAWLVPGKNLGRDDCAALHAAHCVCGGLDALAGWRCQWSRRVHRE